MLMTRVAAVCISLAILLAPVTGCFSNSEDFPSVPPEDLQINPSPLVGAVLQEVEFMASSPMSVHVPYLVREAGSEFFTNGTTLDFAAPGILTIEMIAPSNIGSAFFLLGKEGAFHGSEMPFVRDSNQSWSELFGSEGFLQGPYSWVEHPVARENRSGFSVEEGSMHGSGLIDGLSAFEWLEAFADPDSGYNERWGPFTLNDPNYMRAAEYVEGYLSGMGWDAEIHRYWISDFS